MALDAILAPSAEGVPTWQRYLSLPRACLAEKVTAELYRVLRVLRLVTFHPHGHVEIEDGIVKFNGAVNKVALSLEITAPGVVLLESTVAYYLNSLRPPYPQAYIEAMLVRYFADIVAEIKRFGDEDCNLYQFRPKYAFNRHFRFDCDNPKTQTDGRFSFDRNRPRAQRRRALSHRFLRHGERCAAHRSGRGSDATESCRWRSLIVARPPARERLRCRPISACVSPARRPPPTSQ